MWRRRPGRSIRSSIRTGRRIWTRRGCICSRLDVASHIKTRNLAAFLTPRIQEAAAFLIIECVRDRVIVKGGGKEHETFSFVQNGRASGRERVGQYVLLSVVAVSLKKKAIKTNNRKLKKK